MENRTEVSHIISLLNEQRSSIRRLLNHLSIEERELWMSETITVLSQASRSKSASAREKLQQRLQTEISNLNPEQKQIILNLSHSLNRLYFLNSGNI